MRRHQIIPFILTAIISALGGAGIGYTIGMNQQSFISETASIPAQYLAATSPQALQWEAAYTAPEGFESPRYMLGTDHGFVAVFCASDQSLKERTRTPESALTQEERERLADGIYIYTEEQLLRALEDYGS